MKKITLNYLIDLIMFLLLTAILSIGFLMKFVLITGQEKWIKYGRNVDMYFLGMDRHEWGRIHLILGLLLIAFLILHLILHWRSITKFFNNFLISRILRFTVVSILVIISSTLIIFPFVVHVNISELKSGYGHQRMNYLNEIPDTSSVFSPRNLMKPESNRDIFSETQDTHKDVHTQRKHQRQELLSEIEVRGYLTLQEVSEKYNVPVDQIKEKLNIPLNTSDNERLGRLRNWYGFTMSDVREAIYAERNKKLHLDIP